MAPVIQVPPVEAGILIPFGGLRELLTHEEQLLARVGPLVGKKTANSGELGALIARHLVDQGALPVHDLVMGERQHELL